MSTLNAADGTTLQLAEWPAAARARGTVLLVHGLGEHAGRYGWLAHQLNAAGWQVMGYDHRGHGRSTGPRGVIPDEQTLLRDLAQVIDHARARWSGPLVLLGHSMGGLIAARFVGEALAQKPAAWSRAVDALVLSSPALDAGLSPLQQLMLKAGMAMTPDKVLGNGLKPAWVSRDEAIVQAYIADPLVHDRITPRLVRFIVDGGEQVCALAPCWATPTLLLWAGADRCVAPRGSTAFAAAAPPSVVKARCFDGLYHEIFNEPEKAVVAGELLRWLAARSFSSH